MQQRSLGRQGLTTSAIGYGSMGTKMAYGHSDDTTSIAAIRHAVELGVTHFDTAELYGWGEGEKLLGIALAPFRDEVTIGTKFGWTQEFGFDSRPDHIRTVIDASLVNLGVEAIDVLYQHVDDPAVPVEDVVGVMAEYVAAGKAKYLGLSNTSAENIRRAHAVHPVSVVQAEYSIFSRESEELLPLLDELGVGLVAYSPLARGFLSGSVRPGHGYEDGDMRGAAPWWAPENFDANIAITEQLTELATSKGATLSQLSLAWLLARREDVVPIPGSRSTERVAQNTAAADLELSDADLARIQEVAPAGGIGGRVTF